MMGVAHHTTYLHWFEQMRFGFLERILGLSYEVLERDQFTCPLIGCNVRYLQAVLFADKPVGLVDRAAQESKRDLLLFDLQRQYALPTVGNRDNVALFCETGPDFTAANTRDTSLRVCAGRGQASRLLFRESAITQERKKWILQAFIQGVGWWGFGHAITAPISRKPLCSGLAGQHGTASTQRHKILDFIRITRTE